MLIGKFRLAECVVKGVVVIYYVDAAVDKKVAVVFRPVRVVNHSIEKIYFGQERGVYMRKVGCRLEYVLAVVDIQRREDKLI